MKKRLIMQLLMVFALACALPATAQTKGTKLVTLSFSNEPLSTALKRIEKASDVKILFVYDDVKGLTVNASVQKATATQAVNEVLAGTQLTYTVKGSYISVAQQSKGGLNAVGNGEKNITGFCIDEKGEPLPGVVVRMVGNNGGTVTDVNGYFQMAVSNDCKQIEAQFMGMTTERVVLGNARDIRITMHDASKMLDDIVVVGYGATQRKDFTGSVSIVDAGELKELPVATVDDALMGRASGVQVVKADGTPGGAVRIRIRGGASLSASADPLYIIDGIPTEIKNNYVASTDQIDPMEWANYGEQDMGGVSASFMRGLNNLSGLNVNDIESINILKDASATAIYGSKAANGVVIITTKKGRRDQKPTFDFHYYYNVSAPLKEEQLDGKQYVEALTQSLQTSITNLRANEPMPGYFDRYVANAQEKIGLINSIDNANTDWLDLVLRTAQTHNVDFSVRGGGNNSRYYTAFGYTGQDGVIIGTNYNRMSGKVNVDFDIKPWMRMGTNANISYTKNNINSGVYSQALSAPPVLSPYNADGSYAKYDAVGGVGASYEGFQNPLAVAQCTNQAKTYNVKGSLFAEFDLVQDLKFKTTYSLDLTNYNQFNYTPSFVGVSDGFYGYTDENNGAGTNAHRTMLGTFWENTLTYDHYFGEDHHLNVLAGHAWEQQTADWFSASGKGYPDDKYLNGLGSAQQASKVDGANPDYKVSLLSFYARVNYTWLDRYLLTLTGRSDASSKFSKAHRVGYFPSGAMAWRIAEEKWLKDVDWIDEIKLRASVGKTGTQAISDYMFLTLYRPGAYAGSSALYPSQLGNDEIKWEGTSQWDLGLDYSFLDGRLSGTIGYYNKTTDGALLSIPIAPSSGFTSLVSNIAKIRNVGVEFDINADIIRTKDWRWNASLNISHNSSKCLKLQGGNLFTSADNRKELNLGTSVYKEGEPLGLLCGRVAKGLIETQEQLNDYKNRFGMWMYMQPDLGIGSVEYDLDETGFYYEDVIGNSQPDFFGGLSTSVQYKNWGVSAHFTFSYGNDLMYMKDVTDASFSSMGNRGVRVLEASSADNYTGKMLSTYNSTTMLTNLNVYDASYMKCNSLTLTYSVPQKTVKSWGLDNLSAYITGSNLFTITKYPGPDPAVSDDPYSITGGGRDVSSYPTVRSFTFGVRVGF